MKLNGRWFPQIVDRDSGNLYPIYPLIPCSDFYGSMRVVFILWCWLLNLLVGDLR